MTKDCKSKYFDILEKEMELYKKHITLHCFYRLLLHLILTINC